MKIVRSISRFFVAMLVLSNGFLGVKPASAQLSIGSDGLWIKKETFFSINGLELAPAATLNLVETEVQRSATPVTFYGSPSISQVYTFSTPITFAGVVRLHYKPSALDGAAASDLQLIYEESDGGPLKLVMEADVNTKDRYVASEFDDPITVQLLTATAFGITTPEISDVALTLSTPLQVGNTLVATYTFTDANPDDEDHSTVVWYRYDAPSGDVGKIAIPGATGKSYALVAEDIGKFISFEVTAHDGTVAGATVESNREGLVHEQGVRYVKQGATGNGYSWADASGDLQAMINASSAGEEVWVAVGEYQRGAGQSFSMKEGVKIYGGFPSVGTPGIDERDWEEYETILKGNGNSVVRNNRNGLTAAAVLDGFTLTGGSAYDGGGMYNNQASPTLTNVAITHNTVSHYGGGMYNTNSSPALTHVIIADNTAEAHGGGVYQTGASSELTMEHVTVSNNTAGYDGGGINSGSDTEMADVIITGNKGRSGGGVQQTGSNSTFTMERATVSDNIATAHGGGINKTGGGQFTLEHVTVSDNTAGYDGGGINSSADTEMTDVTITGNKGRSGGGIQQTSSSSSLTVIRAIINDNTASQHGGGISSGNNLTLTEVEISGNSANQHGGGIYKSGTSSSLLMTGVTVSGNLASWDGGGMHINSGANLTNVTITGNKGRDGGGISGTGGIELALTNGTISGNTATGRGGGVYQTNGASLTMTNSIIWNNRAGSSTTSASAAVYSNGGITEVSHSLIANSGGSDNWDAAIGTDGGGNIDADPLFVAGIDPADATTTDGDFRLQSVSPAINTGDPQTNTTDYPVQVGDKDVEGNTRIVGGRTDLGAYENQTPGEGVHTRYVKPGVTGNGYSWAGASGDLQAMITASTPGDEVWVAAGEYQPVSGQSFSMKEGVKIYGGFPATGNPDSDDRDWRTHGTILKGNGNSVVRNDNNGLTAAAVLDGFTVAGGSASVGGGIYNQHVSPTFTNLIISGNTASVNGGGMCNETASPTLTNVLISGNKAHNYGGIVFRDPANAVLTNVTITGNYADVSGGGIAIGKESTVTLINGIIWNNRAGGNTNSTDASVYRNGTLHFSNSLIANSRDGNGVWRAAIGTDNGGNIDADPLFVGGINPATAPSSEGDFTLQAGGPALNAGDPQTNEPGYAVQAGEQDLAAKPRIVDNRIDMGAYERQTKSQKVEIAGLEDGELHVTYGQEDFVPEVTTIPAGRPVTFSLPVEDNETASIVGGKIKIHAAGEVELTVIADGDTEYDAATVTVPLVIGKKAITVSLDTEPVITKIYDGDRAATLTADHYVLADIVEGDVVTMNSTAIYDNKNIGDDKAITVSDFELAGADAANYALTTETATITGSITARPLTVTLDDEPKITKVYDGDNKIALAADNYKLSGIVDGEVLTISGVAVFDNPNAGDKKEVTVMDFELGGADAGNYEMVTESVTIEGSITPKGLTVTADADQHKVYGSDDPALTFEATGFEGDDDEHVFTGALTRATGEDVDTYAITQGTLSAGGNYTIAYTGEEFSITPKGLTVAVDAGQSKVYGSDDPALRFEATGFAWDDDKTVFTGALSRDGGEDVGTYGITQGTLDAGDNYTIVYTGAGFSITPKELTVKADAGQSKVYGSADPALTFTATGFEQDDDESVLTGSLSRAPGEDVDSYAITQGTLAAGSNYTISYTATDFAITLKSLTVTAGAGQSKVYGSADPVLTFEATGFERDDDEGVLTGALSRAAGEDVNSYAITQGTLSAGANYTIAYTAANFAITPKSLAVTVDAGQSKVYGSADPALTFGATGFERDDDEDILAGALSREAGEDVDTYAIGQGTLDAGDNYTIAYAGADFEITPKELTVKADADQSKVYGSDDPTLTFEATGFAWDDDKTVFTGVLARAAGEDVDTYAITQGTLSAGSNYTIIYTGASFSITPKELTVKADAEQGKVYGSADPALTFTAIGFERDDDVTVLTGTLVRAIGEDVDTYAITQGTLSVGDNYTMTYTGADFEIMPKTLMMKADAGQSKVYGSDDSVLTYTASGFAFEEDENILAGTLSREPGEGVGRYAIGQGTLDAGDNYTITYTGKDFAITPKALTVTLNDLPEIVKVYDGTDIATPAAANYVLAGRIPGDDLTISGAAIYGDKDAGIDKEIVVSDFELAGADAPNYHIITTSANTTGIITAKPLAVMLDEYPLITKEYDGSATATVGMDNYHLSGIVGEDEVTIEGTATYEDANAGTEKEIIVSGFVLGGADKTNYTVATADAFTRGTITPKELRVALNSTPFIEKVYDGNNTAMLAADNYALAGIVDGDDVSVSGAATYADAGVGNNKTVTVTDFVLGGAEAENYRLSTESATATGRITAGTASAMDTGAEISLAEVGKEVTVIITARDAYGHPVTTVPPSAFSVSVSGANSLSMDVTNNGDGTYSAAYTPEIGGTDELSILLDGAAVSGSPYRYAVSDFPGAPSGLRAKAGNRQVLLEWEAPADVIPAVADYVIEYSSDSGATWTVPDREPSSSARSLVIGLENNRRYVFRVSAVNAVGTGPASGTVQAIPAEPVPDEGGNLPEPDPGTPVVITDGKVEAVTLEVIDGEYLKLSGEGYVMELASLGVDGERFPISAIDAIIRLLRGAGAQVYVSGHGFEPGTVVTVYLFSVPELVGHLPVDGEGRFAGTLPIPASLELGRHTLQANGIVAGGGGERSVSVGLLLVDNRPQEIGFEALADRTYGDGPVTLGATASSGLPVSYTVTDSDGNATGMASITDNNKLHIHGVGDIQITASQPGDVEYAAAVPVSRTLHIAKAPLSVRVSDATRAYGEANPVFGLTYSGFVNGDDASSLDRAPSASTDATETSAPGSYAITVSGGESPNYAFTYHGATLTIHKAQQAITFTAPAEVNRDAGSIQLDVSSSSGLPVMLSIDDEQVATVNGSTLDIHRLGTVTITATQGGNGNYGAAEPVTVTIRVTDPSSDFPIRVHRALSPNGDGINEFLMVEGIRDYPDNRVTVISRNGTVLWEASGYDNDRVAFRGISTAGLKLPAGTYFYIVEVRNGGKWEHRKGYFVIKY